MSVSPEDVARRLVDRHRASPGGRVRHCSGVDLAGLESPVGHSPRGSSFLWARCNGSGDRVFGRGEVTKQYLTGQVMIKPGEPVLGGSERRPGGGQLALLISWVLWSRQKWHRICGCFVEPVVLMCLGLPSCCWFELAVDGTKIKLKGYMYA